MCPSWGHGFIWGLCDFPCFQGTGKACLFGLQGQLLSPSMGPVRRHWVLPADLGTKRNMDCRHEVGVGKDWPASRRPRRSCNDHQKLIRVQTFSSRRRAQRFTRLISASSVLRGGRCPRDL